MLWKWWNVCSEREVYKKSWRGIQPICRLWTESIQQLGGYIKMNLATRGIEGDIGSKNADSFHNDFKTLRLIIF